METATAAPVVASPPKKATKKPKTSGPKKAKAPAAHPKYTEMAVAAIKALKERGGSSRQAIHKYIMSHFNVGHDTKVVNTHLKMALKRAVTSGKIKHAKGAGASGSFRLGEKATATKKARKPAGAKKAKAPKKARTPKPKMSTSGDAKPKTKKAKTPKKAKAAGATKPKKAAGATKPKKAKTPRPKVEKKRKTTKAAKPKTPKSAGKKATGAKKPKAKKATTAPPKPQA